MAGAALVVLFCADGAEAAWSALTQVSVDSTGDSGNPDMVRAPGNALYVVYESNKSGNFDVYFRCSTDGGATWQPEVNLLDAGSRLGNQQAPRIAATLGTNGSTIWVAVVMTSDSTDADKDIWLLRPTGASVASPCALSSGVPILFDTEMRQEDSPDVDIDRAGNTYTAWRRDPGGPANDHEIIVRFLQPAPSLTLNRADQLFLGNTFGDFSEPAIIVTGANATTSEVVVANKSADLAGGGGDGFTNVVFWFSNDGGAIGTWNTGLNYGIANTHLDQVSLEWSRFTSPPQFYWAFRGGNNAYVRVVEFNAGSSTSTPHTQVNATSPIQQLGGIASIPNLGRAMLVYSTGFATPDVYAALTTNLGVSWSETPIVTAAATNFPRVALGTLPGTQTSAAWAVMTSDADASPALEVKFSRDIATGVTAARVEDLAAERIAGGGARISWRLVNDSAVDGMTVLAGDTPIGAELAPGLSDLFVVSDESVAPEYMLAVRLADGTIEEYGPVAAAGGAEDRDGRGCGVGWPAAIGMVGLLAARRRVRA